MYQSAKEIARKVGSRSVELAVLAGGVAAGSAHAAGPDFSTLTAAVDWGTTTAALLGIAAGVAVLYMTWKGAKMIVSAIRGA